MCFHLHESAVGKNFFVVKSQHEMQRSQQESIFAIYYHHYVIIVKSFINLIIPVLHVCFLSKSTSKVQSHP